MATRAECPLYDRCKLVLWRKDRPDGHMTPLPEDGDCGKLVKKCGRANPNIPLDVEHYGPVSDDEIKLAFPEIPNKHNRRPRRIVGGGHR